LFSNEAGQGSSPIAHSAAKTREPVREAVVAGLEPFIDTIVVCTFSALIILATGVWNRGPEARFEALPELVATATGGWTLESLAAPARDGAPWAPDELVFAIVRGDVNDQSGNDLHRLEGRVVMRGGAPTIEWAAVSSSVRPTLRDDGIYVSYVGATLTGKAFDSATPGLGKWLVTVSVWLFAISTIISWSYYGEQGMVFMFGGRLILPYKLFYCALIIIATWGFIETDVDLDNLTGFGTGVMLFANVPIMWIFGHQAMHAYHDYIARLDAGHMVAHTPPRLEDVVSGRDVR
jgi:AGCS family alanine or glycine:cation symporter